MAVWVPLGGLVMMAAIFLMTVAGLARLPGKLATWVPWVGGIAGGLCALAAGVYATNTWISDFIGWVIGIHPILTLVIGLGSVFLVWKSTMAAIPDDFVSVSLTTGLVMSAFLFPSLMQALPAGDVGDIARDAVQAVSAFAVDLTEGWFRA